MSFKAGDKCILYGSKETLYPPKGFILKSNGWYYNGILCDSGDVVDGFLTCYIDDNSIVLTNIQFHAA